MTRKNDYQPSSLPAVSSVEIVSLREINPNRVDQFMYSATDAPSIEVAGEAAQIIATLWRQLPSDAEARCHIPIYGLRFKSGSIVVCEASICWECNNIYGTWGANEFHYAFDGESGISKTLLREIESTVAQEP